MTDTTHWDALRKAVQSGIDAWSAGLLPATSIQECIVNALKDWHPPGEAVIAAKLLKLAVQLRNSRAPTYASENAEHYRGFDAGQLRASQEIERLIREAQEGK